MNSYGLHSQMAPDRVQVGAHEVLPATVAAEIRDLYVQLQALDDVTGRLRLGLAMVITDRPVPVPEEPGSCREAATRCELAGQINAATTLASNITTKVSDILRNLDLD